MAMYDKHLLQSDLPEFFTWTKFGTESGERVQSIFWRKEVERRQNGGIFLWGIGQSIRPSLGALLTLTSVPEVLFSPMKSPPAKRDVVPSELVAWCDAVGYDGRPFRIPQFSLVTSSRSSGSERGSHFALVCQLEVSLLSGAGTVFPFLLTNGMRNVRTGSVLGASQVTSVVRRVGVSGSPGTEYPVVARARLVYPYLVQLFNGFVIPGELRLDRVDVGGFEDAVQELVRLRESRRIPAPRAEQLVLV